MSATITAAQVKELRDRTGAGMMDCKNALRETNGDVEADPGSSTSPGADAAAAAEAVQEADLAAAPTTTEEK